MQVNSEAYDADAEAQREAMEHFGIEEQLRMQAEVYEMFADEEAGGLRFGISAGPSPYDDHTDDHEDGDDFCIGDNWFRPSFAGALRH